MEGFEGAIKAWRKEFRKYELRREALAAKEKKDARKALEDGTDFDIADSDEKPPPCRRQFGGTRPTTPPTKSSPTCSPPIPTGYGSSGRDDLAHEEARQSWRMLTGARLP